jgi:hypothetical protein
MSDLGIPTVLSYPAICLCGHSEYIYGWTQAEIEYQKDTRSRFFCTACSIGPAIEFSKEADREIFWGDYEMKRQYVIKKIRELARSG